MQIHFIAIGGAAMHNLALALHDQGHTVTGSDDEIFDPARSRLQAKGILPQETGWFPEKIYPGLSAIILGMHARKDNPELQRALELKIPIYSFPAFIYENTKQKKRAVIGGSHGKTSITSMIMHALKFYNRTFDYLVGSQIEGFQNMAGFSEQSEWAVMEGDEYLASALEPFPKFHLYHPHVAVLSGIAWDHVNVFPTFELYQEQFRIFIQRMEPGGILFYDERDEVLKNLVEADNSPIRKHPYQPVPSERTEGELPTRILFEGKAYFTPVFGKHNMANLEAARLVCREMGLSGDAFYTAMKTFKGAARRLELLKHTDQYVLYKDFAHAPSKVRATIKAVREQYPNRRLIALLELHTFSSLNKDFLQEFAGCMDAADEALVYFSAHSFEMKRLTPFTESDVKHGFGNNGLEVCSAPEDLLNFTGKLDTRNAVILLMSSGNWGGVEFPF